MSDAARNGARVQPGHPLAAFPPVLAPGVARPVAYVRVEGPPGFGDLRNARGALVRSHRRLCHFMQSSHAATVTPLDVDTQHGTARHADQPSPASLAAESSRSWRRQPRNARIGRLRRRFRRRRRHEAASGPEIRALVRTRTLKEAGCRRSSRWMRCCARDGGAGLGGLVALRGRCAGGGRKPPRAAAVKSRGGERRGRSRAVSAAGVDHEGERKRTAEEASKGNGWHRNQGIFAALG